MKKFKLWAISDALTKIGCGIYGASLVSYFFNLSLNNQVDYSTYYGFVVLGSLSFIVGYFGLWRSNQIEVDHKK